MIHVSASRLVARSALAQGRLARGYASAASAASFNTAEAAGIPVASRDLHSPIAKLAVVAKAGSRYQSLPGLASGLEHYAFKNTQKRSALRIHRESELLGAQLNTFHTREGLVLEASFFRDNFPYFAELLAEVVSETKYTSHELHEIIDETLLLKEHEFTKPSVVAQDAAHNAAFHSGLGSALYPSQSTKSYIDEHNIAAFAESAYAKSNIALVTDGVSAESASQYLEQFFKSVPAKAGPQALSLNTAATKYYGGESRVAHAHGNSVVIAFQGAGVGTPKPELDVLAALLGGQSSIKWSSGFSLLAKVAATVPGVQITTKNNTYSDAGLLTIQLDGSAAAIKKAVPEIVKIVKNVASGSALAKEDVAKAVAQNKFAAAESVQGSREAVYAAGAQLLKIGASPAATTYDAVTPEKVQAAAKALLASKVSYAAVGDLFALPYAEEVGLRV